MKDNDEDLGRASAHRVAHTLLMNCVLERHAELLSSEEDSCRCNPTVAYVNADIVGDMISLQYEEVPQQTPVCACIRQP